MEAELLTAATAQIAPEDWALTPRSVQQTVRSVVERVAALEEEVFVHVRGVEPTNNAAERALRPAVIWRRTSLGTQSALGSQFVVRLLTVTLTLRSQHRNVLAYLTTACEAARQGEPAPSLLPDLSLLELEPPLAIAA